MGRPLLLNYFNDIEKRFFLINFPLKKKGVTFFSEMHFSIEKNILFFRVLDPFD